MKTLNLYQQFEEEIKNISNMEKKPKLLLHACCAPCSTATLEVLKAYFEITIFFFNPSIMPKEEYDMRLDAINKLLSFHKDVNLIEGEWKNEEYLKLVFGNEMAKEGGKRCEICFVQRLKETATMAKNLGFDYFCSTLTISPHKNAELVNEIGKNLQNEIGVKWLISDFKKKNGFLRSIELSKQYDLYRQTYCGCRFTF